MKKNLVLLLLLIIAIAAFLCKDQILNLFDKDLDKTELNEPAEDAVDFHNKVHVAFAGGGWRAHTGHSAWTIGLLNGKRKLSDAFSQVGAISSNSGGSWYSTMLMFSEAFVSDIEKADAATTWPVDGWFAKQKIHFDNADCGLAPDGFYLECVFDSYTGHDLDGGTYWKQMVDKLVFRDYPLKNLTLSSPRQSWAKYKPLLLATTMLNNAAVLNGDALDYVSYYQVCPEGESPFLNGDEGSTCSIKRPVDVTAATFSSIPSGINYKASPFFPAISNNPKSTFFNLGYSGNYDSAGTYNTEVQLPLSVEHVPVMTAAASSSAAGGFGASEHITGSFETSYILSDDALTFSLDKGTVQYLDASQLSIQDLANQKVVRLADGGTADNNGVAQLVRSLQLNGQKSDINIVAFDNVAGISNPKGGAPVGIDIASLFGFSDPFGFTYRIFGFPVVEVILETPDLQVFDSIPLYTTTHNWIQIDPKNPKNQLVYTAYQFTTVDNPALGIVGGSKGTLHSFTCAYPKAAVAPLDGDSDFKAYKEMFNFILDGLNNPNDPGLKYLEKAMGLSGDN